MPKRSNWRHFFINSLKQKVPISKDNLYVNEKVQKGGALSKKAVKIVSPTIQATNQARDSVKHGAFADNEMYVNQRPVDKVHKVRKTPAGRVKKRRSPKKKPSKKTTIRRYKKK